MIIIYTIIILYIYYSIYHSQHKYNLNDYDIICSPGGNYGFYMMGICDFIKKKYNIKNKKIIGFSAGSFCSVFLKLNNQCSDQLLVDIFKRNDLCGYNIKDNLQHIVNVFNNNIKLNQFIDNNFHIVTSSDILTNIVIHKNFISPNDIMNCCTASSFIPLITYKSLFFFFRGKLLYDAGYIYYKKIKKNYTKHKLTISYNMFNRWPKKNDSPIHGLSNVKLTIYDLYIMGYSYAYKNKKLFDKYFI